MNQGSCLCGAIRFEVEGPINLMGHCHCSMCRKHHGSLFATFVAVPVKQFRWLAGERGVNTYRSSPNGSRSFCGTCGSVVPGVMPEIDMAFVPAGNLEGDPGVRPQSHMFVGSKADWYTITDDLPRYDKYPPGFDAPDNVRPSVAPKAGYALGSCLCADVAFEIEGAPTVVRNCHCSRCRRARSAAYATNLFYPAERFGWTRGQDKVADFKLPGARFFATAFCRRCGSSLPRVSPERGIVLVPAGSLDTDPGMQPTMHIFVGSKASWFEITDALPQFAEGPPSK
jgi:hypothetical protein